MSNELKTAFWRKAAQGLPANLQARYVGYFERAERWELALEGLIEVLERARVGLTPGAVKRA